MIEGHTHVIICRNILMVLAKNSMDFRVCAEVAFIMNQHILSFRLPVYNLGH